MSCRGKLIFLYTFQKERKEFWREKNKNLSNIVSALYCFAGV